MNVVRRTRTKMDTIAGWVFNKLFIRFWLKWLGEWSLQAEKKTG